MNVFTWVIVIFFASLGITQVLEWILNSRKPIPPKNGYQITLLSNDVDILEAQIRHTLTQTHWNGLQPIFIDRGLTGEAQQLCNILLANEGYVPICKLEDVSQTIEQLQTYHLQSNT